jgi:ferredoxin-NADP reductase
VDKLEARNPMVTLELAVEEVKLETSTIKSVRLALGGRPFSFKPGQYCLVELDINGEREDRALSIANAPTRPGFLLFATRSGESPYKKVFFSLKPGDTVTVTGPMGRFIYDEAFPNSILLSGGIGITPLKSMIEYVSDRRLSHSVILLFGNRSPREIPFRKELDELADSNPTFTLVHVVSETAGEVWKGEKGRIDERLIRKVVAEVGLARYYICGPPQMVFDLRGILERRGVAQEQIKIENFEGYL